MSVQAPVRETPALTFFFDREAELIAPHSTASRPDPALERLAWRLLVLRKARPLTPCQLVELIGIRQALLAQLAAPAESPTADKILQLLRTLHVAIALLDQENG